MGAQLVAQNSGGCSMGVVGAQNDNTRQKQRAFQFYSDKHMPKHNLRLKTKFCY